MFIFIHRSWIIKFKSEGQLKEERRRKIGMEIESQKKIPLDILEDFETYIDE